MWNTVKGIWRAIDALAWIFWIVTTLLLFYFGYKLTDNRYRFLFRQPIPAVKEDGRRSRWNRETRTLGAKGANS